MISTNRTCGVLVGIGLPVLLVWMVWSAWLTGPVISDSWQSVGPAVFSQRPGDLSGVFLGDFDGYAQTWGHHWPGWALFMSLLLPWLNFHPIMVFSIEVLIVALSALTAFRIGVQTKRWWWAAALSSLVLLNPEINVSLSMMRPEPLTGLLMILLSWAVIDGPSRRSAIFLTLACSAALPLLHVLGVVAPPAMLGTFALWHRLSPRAFWNDRRAPLMLALAGGWLAGIGTLAVWFLGNADRLHQFKENLAAQRLSAHGFLNSFRSCYFADVGSMMMLLLWVALVFAVLACIHKSNRNLRVLLWAAMPLAAVVFSTLAHNPNRLHLAAVVPCALVACGAGVIMNQNRLTRCVWCSLIPVLGFSLAFHLNRAVKVWKTNAICARPAQIELLKRHQGNGRLFIPLSLWEAAATLREREALFYTFPNVAAPGYRMEAEHSLFEKSMPGDRLIFDVTQNLANNDYFDREAFVHLTHVDADSLGPLIETFEVEGMSGSRLYHVIQIVHPPFRK